MIYTDSTVCFSFGMAMAGKGTMSRIMGDVWRFEHLCARDMIQDHGRLFPDFLANARAAERKGELIEDSIMNSLFSKNFQPTSNGIRYNFDGIPRTVGQAKHIIKELRTYGIKRISLLNLKMTAEESVNRFKEQADSEDRKGRLDADLQVHINRIEIHEKHSPSILDYLQSEGVCIYVIKATDNPVHKVLQVQRFLDLEVVPENYLRRLREKYSSKPTTVPVGDLPAYA